MGEGLSLEEGCAFRRGCARGEGLSLEEGSGLRRGRARGEGLSLEEGLALRSERQGAGVHGVFNCRADGLGMASPIPPTTLLFCGLISQWRGSLYG